MDLEHHELMHAHRYISVSAEACNWHCGKPQYLHTDDLRDTLPAMHTSPLQPPCSVEDYLAYEAEGRLRHEYIAGEIFAMTGASLVHNIIAGNLFTAFTAHLRGGPYRAFISDVKVRLKNGMDHIFYYPDVVIACGQGGIEKYYLTSPTLIVEVLSPTTEGTDRREKALHYKQIPTLEEYVLVAQESCEVTVYRRTDSWGHATWCSPQDVAEFRSIGLSLPLSEIYADLPPPT
jgi:Uma2 family endonuclease